MTGGIKIKIAGEDLGLFVPGRIDLRGAFAIKSAAGLTPRELFEGLQDMDPAAMQAVVWFLRTHRFDEDANVYQPTGANLEIGSVNFALDDFGFELTDEEPPKEETSPGGEPSTSGSSPTSAT